MESGRLDLRPRSPRDYALIFRVGEIPLSSDDLPFAPLRPSEQPQVSFDGVLVPNHLTPTLLSHFPAGRPKALALDLGCGNGVHRAVVEHAGFEWVGLDHGDQNAPVIRGDAHALPFESETFEFILSIAVLEHIRYPFVAIREALRVLKPGGIFIGTVAFLEPFHGDSHYHHTHLGTLNVLRFGGFEVETVATDCRWRVLQAQAQMALFPKLPAPVSRALVVPLDALHRAWWALAVAVDKRATPVRRIRQTAGAFTFIAHRPEHTL
jgi:SAM-dependent methyltransferase